MTISVLDMFCGAGGSSAGARLIGSHVIHGIDAWELAARTFKDNFNAATVDIRTLGPSSQPPRALRPGDIDLLLASPECTNHSPAKEAKPRCEDSRLTSHYVINFARRLNPRWIVLENVVQLRNWHAAQFTSLLREEGRLSEAKLLAERAQAIAEKGSSKYSWASSGTGSLPSL